METNTIFWIALLASVGMYLLDDLASWLNLRALKPKLPPEFSGIYDEEEYRRFLAYTAATARMGRVSATYDLGILLAFWLLGGFQWLDVWSRGFHLGVIGTGLAYIGALGLGSWLLGLPLEIYDTFRIEARFGFNKTTPGTFIADQVKSLLLAAVLGGGVLALVLYVFQHGGRTAWLYAWGCAALLMIAMVYAAPALILPLFNKMTPMAEGELRREIFAYAERLHFPLSEISIMDGSRRSTKANAFFTGFGGTKRVVLYDTLVSNHTTEELVAVLAHEIGHYQLRHIVQGMMIGVLNIGLLLFLADWLMHNPALYAAFGVKQESTYAGLVLFMVLYGPLGRLLGLARSALSRHHEYAADRFASETTQHPAALGTALKKLSRHNLGNLAPHWLSVVLYHSHPPVLERVRALGGQS